MDFLGEGQRSLGAVQVWMKAYLKVDESRDGVPMMVRRMLCWDCCTLRTGSLISVDSRVMLKEGTRQ
ncbi:hypothetical protein V6N13_099516 [Hibiscus sabdariffa]